jgi:hypothetical protein
VIGLPQWHFPSELPPPPATDFSIISQVDGLIFKCQGLRVERDMRAVQAKSAFCDHIGMERYESTGSFVGWYHADPLLHMPGIVATVASHQGIGVFIVPAEPAPQSTGIRLCEGGDVVDWLRLVQSKAIMTFTLPAAAFSPPTGVGMQAVFAQFGENGDFKAAPRKEKCQRTVMTLCRRGTARPVTRPPCTSPSQWARLMT